jgi:hypothetical protein
LNSLTCHHAAPTSLCAADAMRASQHLAACRCHCWQSHACLPALVMLGVCLLGTTHLSRSPHHHNLHSCSLCGPLRACLQVLAFVSTKYLIPNFYELFINAGLFGKDLNKTEQPRVYVVVYSFDAHVHLAIGEFCRARSVPSNHSLPPNGNDVVLHMYSLPPEGNDVCTS